MRFLIFSILNIARNDWFYNRAAVLNPLNSDRQIVRSLDFIADLTQVCQVRRKRRVPQTVILRKFYSTIAVSVSSSWKLKLIGIIFCTYGNSDISPFFIFFISDSSCVVRETLYRRSRYVWIQTFLHQDASDWTNVFFDDPIKAILTSNLWSASIQ